MSEKIYAQGMSIKKADSKYPVLNLSICYEDLVAWMKGEGKPHAKVSKNGKHYYNLDIKERKETGQFGNTHYVQVNTYEKKPEQTEFTETEEEIIDRKFDKVIKNEINGLNDDIPF